MLIQRLYCSWVSSSFTQVIAHAPQSDLEIEMPHSSHSRAKLHNIAVSSCCSLHKHITMALLLVTQFHMKWETSPTVSSLDKEKIHGRVNSL